MVTGQIEIKNQTVELISELVDLLTAMTTPSNITGAGPPTAVVSQFNAIVLGQLQVIKTKLMTLKA